MTTPTIGVMLTAYKRTHLLERQIAAIRAQTVKPARVMAWNNSRLESKSLACGLDLVLSASENLGVWPRFMLAPMLGTDYIAVFDDDTIPGPRWFENCLKTLETLKADGVHGALLGSCGVGFVNGNRDQRVYAGWKLPMEKAVQADIVGHAWFFQRSLLDFFSPGSLAADHPTCGEDYFLSRCAQQLNWPTICPPHPEHDRDWWGSLEGVELGSDEHALWKDGDEWGKKEGFHQMMKDIHRMKFESFTVTPDGVRGNFWTMPHVASPPEAPSHLPACGGAASDDPLMQQADIGVPQLWELRKLGITPKFMLDCGPGLPGGEAWQAKQLWPEIEIIGFEPQPDRFVALKEAGYPGTLTKYAVTELSGDTVAVKHLGENENAGLTSVDLSDGREWSARTIAIDDVLDLHPEWDCDGLLWMDIEGSELVALSGASMTIDRFSAVLVEVCPGGRKDSPDWCHGEAVARYLAHAGFRKHCEFPTGCPTDPQHDELWVRG